MNSFVNSKQTHYFTIHRTRGTVLKKVIICEDHNIVYDGLKLLLSKSDEYKIVGHAALGKELIPLLLKVTPDILLLDLNLPDTDGLVLLKEIRKTNKQIKIIILTMYHDSFLIEKAREEGANAYVLKNSSNNELMAALDGLDRNKFFVPRAIQLDMDRKKIYRDQFAQKMKLTNREIEIIKSLALGHTSQDIADQLSLSLHTIETHRKNIFRKLEISGIANLIRFAHDNHII